MPPQYAQFAGQAVTQAAAGRAPSAGEWVLDLLAAARLRVGAHLDRRLLADDHLAWLAAADRMCAGSDGIYQGQHPHPRGYGAFARLAGHYLAADPGRGHQQAARHLAANAAGVYGLRDRGRIAPGLAADLCVIGARRADRARHLRRAAGHRDGDQPGHGQRRGRVAGRAAAGRPLARRRRQLARPGPAAGRPGRGSRGKDENMTARPGRRAT